MQGFSSWHDLDWQDGGIKKLIGSDPRLDAIARTVGTKVRRWYDDWVSMTHFILFGNQNVPYVRGCASYNLNLRIQLKDYCDRCVAFRHIREDYQLLKKRRDTLQRSLELCSSSYEYIQRSLENSKTDIDQRNLFVDLQEALQTAKAYQNQIHDLVMRQYDLKIAACEMLSRYMVVCREYVTHLWHVVEYKRIIPWAPAEDQEGMMHEYDRELEAARASNRQRLALLHDTGASPVSTLDKPDSDDNLAIRDAFLEQANAMFHSGENVAKECELFEKMPSTVSTAATNRSITP